MADDEPPPYELRKVLRWVLWGAFVLAVFPGSCILIGTNMDANEKIYAAEGYDVPVPLTAIKRGFGQGLGMGFGEEIGAYINQLTSNETHTALVRRLRYEFGAASKTHPTAWGVGAVAGWLVGVVVLVGIVAKAKGWD